MLDPLTATPDDVAGAVRRVLDDRRCSRVAAARVRAEYLALPSAADAVAEVGSLRIVGRTRPASGLRADPRDADLDRRSDRSKRSSSSRVSGHGGPSRGPSPPWIPDTTTSVPPGATVEAIASIARSRRDSGSDCTVIASATRSNAPRHSSGSASRSATR